MRKLIIISIILVSVLIPIYLLGLIAAQDYNFLNWCGELKIFAAILAIILTSVLTYLESKMTTI